MSAAEKRRLVTFVAVSSLLVAAAILSSRLGPTVTPDGVGPAPARPDPALALATRVRAGLRLSARHFLAAYLRYEVGEDGPAVRRRLRAAATPRFAALLLDNPARSAGGRDLGPARVRSLELSVYPADPRHAFVGGAARRGTRTERFSFEFAYTAAGWRASGVTE